MQAVKTNESHVNNTDRPSIMSLLLEQNRAGYTFLNLVAMNDDYDGPNRYVLEETTAFDLAGRAHRTRQSTGKISDQNTVSDSERLESLLSGTCYFFLSSQTR